ncbi:hypothetical protein PSTG_17517, partial [Puccinia striiformis f. sp. tritici PST-78]
MSASNPVAELFAKILAISQSRSGIPLATRDDLIFQKFSCPPFIPQDEENEGMWYVVNKLMDSLFGVENCKENLRRGKYGIEVVIDYLKTARKHSSWNADELLVLKLERIYQCLKGKIYKFDLETDPPKKPSPKKPQKKISTNEAPLDQSKAVSVSSTQTSSTSNKQLSSSKPKNTPKLTPGNPEATSNPKKRNKNKSTQQATALKFGINQTSLSRWLKEKATIQKRVTYNGGTVKRQRTAAYPQLKQALFNWFIEAQSRQMPINDNILRTKAQKFANLLTIDLKLSNGWLYKFKNRFHINKIELHGEAGSVDKDEAEVARKQVLAIVEGYEPHNVYNADETGLLYRMPPNKSMATETCSGLKGSKVRLTYHLCCNADGSDKLEPLVIGNAKRPRSFGKKLASYWGYDYHFNKTAWMTATIMAPWIQKLDDRFRREKRHVLLLLDNFSAHLKGLEGLSLTNLKVEFLPPNLTSVLQPCDAGIIRAFKAYYRKQFLEFAMTRYEEDPEANGTTVFNINQLEAMHMARSAW